MALLIILSGVLLVGYLLGSIPNAVLVARAHGVNIFEVGSGNPGATNVKRAIGKTPGNLVFFLDLLKGFLAAVWPFLPLMAIFEWTGLPNVVISLICLTGALLGHSFSLFAGFRGGKGVATAMGGLLAIMPLIVIAGVLVWVAVFYTWRYVSLASIAFATSLPLVSGMFALANLTLLRSYGWVEFGIALGVASLIIIRHRDNISRLRKGTELKFEKRRQSKKDSQKSIE